MRTGVLRRQRVPGRGSVCDGALLAPGRRDHRLLRRRRLRRRVPRRRPRRDRRRRHLAAPGRRLDPDGVERRGERLLGLCREARLAERRRLRESHDRRRRRGRRPEHRRPGVRQLRIAGRHGLRRHQRLGADRRRRLRPARRRGRRRELLLRRRDLPLPQPRADRRHQRLQRLLHRPRPLRRHQPRLPLHRRDRLRRPHRHGHPRRHARLLSRARGWRPHPDQRALSGTASISAEGTRRYRNRNEREFAGYRDATDMLMRLDSYEPLSVPFVLHLHRLLFAHTGSKGGQLKSDENLIVSYENGRREIVFTPPPPEETEFLLGELLVRYEDAKREGGTHPLVLIGALILDFLAIHPVAIGNGRLARLLTTYELLAQGYGVARYMSIEQRIYESKNSYYASLYESQRNWHEGQHDVWPWITYLCRILAGAYDDFEQRVAAAGEQTGSKQERVRDYVLLQAPAAATRCSKSS